ncbi:hypothetical protein DKX38_004722 [Salix brachista]|uniref:GOST seven transmembrane domain-containing protein n=1 Tax=Salix brachista TaxID=2182728 RepID=A0A5N5NCA2_9ROSI|nr:hypothetical protein DKX38_004722 [Salix brachista]
MVTQNDADQFTLVFANCLTSLKVSMDVKSVMYNLDRGGKVRDYLKRLTVYRIHFFMLAVAILKTVNLLCEAEDKSYIKRTGYAHGWDVLFYIFSFLKGITLFTLIVLIGTGWSFLKPYLQDKEKKVLMIVIPLQVVANIAQVVIDETGPVVVYALETITSYKYLWTSVVAGELATLAFYVFTGPDNKQVPESLTLVYLPRGHELVIDGSKFRPETKAYIGLHRIVEVDKKEGEVMFGSRERVRVNEGVRFEVYLREERVLEGIFRRDADLERWKLECYGGRGGDDVRVLAVRVAVEGQEREVVEDESDGKCDCDCDGRGLYGGDLEEGCGPDCAEVEMELEGIRWAIDVGVWVMCLGVGYMASRASVKSLRRLRFL